MSYTPVPAIAAGDTLDEVFLNTYWVDNMAASVPDVFSAKGQLAIGLGVDSMGVLNVGSNREIIIADSGETLGMRWGEIPTPKTTMLKKSVDQTIPGTNTAVTWDQESQDDEGLHSLVSNTSRITFVTSGLYLLICRIYIAANCTQGSIKKNGSTLIADGRPNTASGSGSIILTAIESFVAGDYVEVYSAGSGSFLLSASESKFSVLRLGA